jgi:hypothetical protein
MTMNKVNTAIRKLVILHEEMKRAKYKNVPEHAIPKSKFDVESTNGLTKAIITWLELHGHYCTRLQSQGQYNPTLGRWTKGTTKKGVGDIMAIIQAKHLMIEVKYGKDKLSEHQIKTKREVQKSGGFYFVAKDFESFMEYYEKFTL